LAVAAVADLRSHRPPTSAEELERFETDVLAGMVLARSAAGLADDTIRGELSHLDQLRGWFGRPLWEMEPHDADAYFGRVLRGAPKGTRLAKAAALCVYFEFVELRHKAELHAMTGRVAECPIDEMNRPRGCGSRRCRPRSRRCSPGGRRSWRPAGSSRPRPVTTRRPG
jgi:integrase/recombinase XerD